MFKKRRIDRAPRDQGEASRSPSFSPIQYFVAQRVNTRGVVYPWMWLWFGLALVGCGQEDLVHVDTEKQANEILVELAARQITQARKQPQAQQRATVWKVTVPGSDLLRAREILFQLDLPRQSQGGYERMLSTTGLIPTKTDERARLMYAMSGELERTFELYQDVVRARVHVVLPEDQPMSGSHAKTVSPTAMVLIQHVQNSDAADSMAVPIQSQVQQMVAKSVEGLVADQVMVSYTTARQGNLSIDLPSKPIWTDPRLHLLVGTVVLGVLSIVLIVLLVREKAKHRRLVTQ